MNQKPLSPFFSVQPGGHVLGHVDVNGRLQALKQFDKDQCQQALERTDGLQATVRKALEARIRKLDRATRSESI